MKIAIIIFSLVLLSACSSPTPPRPDGLYEGSHENGQLRFRANLVDEEWHGLAEWFYENGQLRLRGHYVDGARDGLWEFFYENGQLQERANYRAHLVVPLFGLADEWMDEELNGPWEHFYENGQLERRGNLITIPDSFLDIIDEALDERNQPLYEAYDYFIGESVNPDLDLSIESNIIPGSTTVDRDGLWEWFDINGNLIGTMTFRNGELVE